MRSWATEPRETVKELVSTLKDGSGLECCDERTAPTAQVVSMPSGKLTEFFYKVVYTVRSYFPNPMRLSLLCADDHI